MVALHLAVVARGAGSDRAVADAVGREQGGHGVVVGVGPGVVGLPALDRDAVAGKERDRALGKAQDGGGLLVGVQLGVGQPAVIIDRAMSELVADALALLGAGAVAVAGDRVAGPREPGKALDVVLDQRPRARPLKPLHRFPRRRGRAREAAPGQTARDRRVRHPQLCGDQPRTPSRFATAPRTPGREPARWTSSAADGVSRADPEPNHPKLARPLRLGGSDRSRTAPSRPRLCATRRPVAEKDLQQDISRPTQHAANWAATYACPASGLMTSKGRWILEKTHSLCLSPDASTPLRRSERPEARHLVAVQAVEDLVLVPSLWELVATALMLGPEAFLDLAATHYIDETSRRIAAERTLAATPSAPRSVTSTAGSTTSRPSPKRTPCSRPGHSRPS